MSFGCRSDVDWDVVNVYVYLLKYIYTLWITLIYVYIINLILMSFDVWWRSRCWKKNLPNKLNKKSGCWTPLCHQRWSMVGAGDLSIFGTAWIWCHSSGWRSIPLEVLNQKNGAPKTFKKHHFPTRSSTDKLGESLIWGHVIYMLFPFSEIFCLSF